MSELPLRRVQSAKINNLCKLCPTLSNQHQSPNHQNSVSNNPNNINDGINTDQHSLNEQRQKISQQIIIARSQVVPLRQKASELTEKMKFLHPNLLFEIEEPETPESLLFSRLGSERVELEVTLRQLEDLSSNETANKFENDISRYRNNLETIKELVQRGSDTLREKRNSFDVIVHSEIYARVIEQRNRIEVLQKRMNELAEEAHEISENTTSRIHDIPEIRKLNQKVMFFQKRLCSLKHEKNFKMDELTRIRNTRTPQRSPRAKSRRRMNSGIELKKKKQQQLQHQQQQQIQHQTQIQAQTRTQSSASISQLPLLIKTNILSHSMRSRDFHEMLQPSTSIRKSNSNSDINGNGFNFNDSDMSDNENENDSTSENNNEETSHHEYETSNSESDSFCSYFNNDKYSNHFNDNNISQSDNDEDHFDSRLLSRCDARRIYQDHDITMDEEKQKKKRPNLKISIEPTNFANSPPRLQFFDYNNDENFSDGNNGDKSTSGGCLSPMAEPGSRSQEKSPRVVRFAFDYERHQNQ